MYYVRIYFNLTLNYYLNDIVLIRSVFRSAINCLNLQGIHYKSAKKKKGMIVGFVSFETAEQVKSGVEVSISLDISI